MRAATGDADLVRLLREGLSQAVAPDCLDLVLALALSRGCLERVPPGGERLRRFMVGPLTDALEGFVGTVLAASTVDLLAETLTPFLKREGEDARSESGVRMRSPVPPAPTAFPEPDTARLDALPQVTERSDEPTLRMNAAPGVRVILVSHDPDAARRLTARLDPGLSIVVASDVFSVMDAVKNASKQRSVILLDCRHPAISAAMMLNVASRIPEGTQVLLWGRPDQIERQVAPLGHGTDKWLRCNEEALAEDVGALISTVLGRCA